MNERPRQVAIAQRAIAASPDTRALKREARAGNPYVLAFLARLAYVDGAIREVRR